MIRISYSPRNEQSVTGARGLIASVTKKLFLCNLSFTKASDASVASLCPVESNTGMFIQFLQ